MLREGRKGECSALLHVSESKQNLESRTTLESGSTFALIGRRNRAYPPMDRHPLSLDEARSRMRLERLLLQLSVLLQLIKGYSNLL